MAFKGIQSKSDAPSVARDPGLPPPVPLVLAPTPPSADFSEIYEPEELLAPSLPAIQAPGPSQTTPAAPPKPISAGPLNPKLERLIEIVCSDMGSEPEEIKALKAQALITPEEIQRFCMGYYDQRIRPKREALDPLAEAIAALPLSYCFRYVSPDGISAVLSVDRATRPEMAIYHNKTFSLHHLEDHPFEEDSEELTELAETPLFSASKIHAA